jgi:hypothetical protein
MFTRAHHWSLSCMTQIQSTSSHPTSLRSVLIISSHLCLCLPSGFSLQVFTTKILYTFLIFTMHATCPSHVILLAVINITFGKEYKLWSSSLCNILHPPVTPGPGVVQSVEWLTMSRMIGVWFPARAKVISLSLLVQTSYVAYPVSYPTGTEGKAARAWCWHSPPSSATVKKEWNKISTTLYVFMAWCSLSYFTSTCHFIPLWSKYSPQHPILKHPQFSLFSFTPTQYGILK